MPYLPTDPIQRDAFFESVFHGIDQAVFIFNVENPHIEEKWTFRFVGINASYERLTGLKWDDFAGKTPADLEALFSPEGVAAIEARYTACAQSGEVMEYEEMLMIHGRPTWWLTRLVPLLDDSGHTHRIIGSGTDITAFYQAREKAYAAEQSALAANQAKSRFLANMSHEIRTPMSGILGFAELLLDTGLTEDQKEFAETIHRSGRRLLSLINDILDLSKVEADAIVLREQELDLAEVVDTVLSEVVPMATTKGLELSYTVALGVPQRVVADHQRLQQILANLVSNSVKFTDAGEVAVDISWSDPEILITVRDTGLGISEDQQKRLFEPFYQAEDTAEYQYEGTGLGLAITKQLVELMGGTIRCESAQGAGSSFHVRLPLRPVLHRHLVVAAPSPDIDLRGYRALIVEDNQTNRRFISLLLRAWGMEIRAYADGNVALEDMGQYDAFDFVLLDYNMPQIHGGALAQKLRDANPELPLILLSSVGERIDEYDLFDAVLSKPVDQSLLRKTLGKVLPAKPSGGATPKHTSAEDRAETPSPTPRILLAEDDPANQRVYAAFLRKGGYALDVARDGLEAIEALQKGRYDLVLMDIRMPNMNGIECTKHIHATFGDDSPPIVALTGQAMVGDKEAFTKAGMDGYLAKPVSRETLLRCVESFIRPSEN